MNVAAQFSLGKHTYNMEKIVLLKGMGFSRNTQRFTASICRIRVYPPHFGSGPLPTPQVVSALVYYTGKVVLTGASNPEMAIMAAWNLTHLFNSHGIPASMTNFQTENIVAKFHTGFRVDLDSFKEEQGNLVEYEPETFTAAIYKGFSRDKTSFTVLVYKTGSLVVIGSRSRAEAISRYVAICDMLQAHRLLETHDERRFREDIDVRKMGKALKMMTASFATEKDSRQDTTSPTAPVDPYITPLLPTAFPAATQAFAPSSRLAYEPPRKRVRLQS